MCIGHRLICFTNTLFNAKGSGKWMDSFSKLSDLSQFPSTENELFFNAQKENGFFGFVAGAEFYNTSSVHCIVCSPPQVRSLSITIYPPYTLPTTPTLFLPAITTVLSMSIGCFSFFSCFLRTGTVVGLFPFSQCLAKCLA